MEAWRSAILGVVCCSSVGGRFRELRGDVMELLPPVLVLLGDGCDRLGYPAQLM